MNYGWREGVSQGLWLMTGSAVGQKRGPFGLTSGVNEFAVKKKGEKRSEGTIFKGEECL